MKIKWKFVFDMFVFYVAFLVAALTFCDVLTVLIFGAKFFPLDVLCMTLVVTILSPFAFALFSYETKGTLL
jgi:hypothetical protein